MFCSVLISGSAKSRMKGNRVKVPDSPAAVSSRHLRLSTLCKATVF